MRQRNMQHINFCSHQPASVGLLHSAAMKFSLITTIVLLALAQGSFAQDAADLQRLGQYFEEMKTKLIQDLSEMIRNQDLAKQTQAFVEDKQAQLQPLLTQIQEQMRTVATKVEEQIGPMTANMQAQLQPQIDSFQKQMEAIFKKLTDQTMAIAN